MRLRAVRPADLSALYRQLLDSGGRGGTPLSQRTVEYVHAILRMAFAAPMPADQVLTSNPAERAKRPGRTGSRLSAPHWATRLESDIGVPA